MSYSSNAGNSPFGFGWTLAPPYVTRKTDKGLPQYQDADESDIFILSGYEDLMPALVESGRQWARDVTLSRALYGKQYSVHRYRPRVDNVFARIERWLNVADPTDTFWRSIDKNNITTWYGTTAASRIADPADPSRVFTWLMAQTYDDKGNVVSYEYKPDDSVGVSLGQVHERNRTDSSRAVNRYVKRVYYGNRTPYFPELTAEQAVPLPKDWCFELVFDYGDHASTNPTPVESQPWNCRLDPFSTYRAGFEVRTYRLCQRVLMFHSFPDDSSVGNDCLVRSTDLTYAASPPTDPTQPFYSYLLSVVQSGYRSNGAGGYVQDSLPALEFTYTEAVVDPTVRTVDPASLQNLPYGLDGTAYRWADLDGEGLSGILTEQAGGWFYKANLSPINRQAIGNKRLTLPRFAPMKRVAKLPSTASLREAGQKLLSVSGDGQLDLVDYAASPAGYYERTDDEDWAPYALFSSMPVVDWNDPQMRFIDLTGDGFPDLLIAEGFAFRWHQSLATEGFSTGRNIVQAQDEELGPKLIFSDGTESIFLADLCGDGLTDLVRIRNGEVCYWPNRGYGCFGAKITMDNAPLFAHADLFDARQIRLADIDGSGTADIVYFGSGSVQLYFNQSGNGWGPAKVLNSFPQMDSESPAEVLDLLGNGTACLVWSSKLLGNAHGPMRYVDLMGGQKPHLLVRQANNLGAETRIHYAPSTKFYVADKLAGTPWVTRLPFPVQVVERIETFDAVGRNLFVSCYVYHHGYYDGVEREFRGFGRVDQWDTEESATLSNSADMPAPSNTSAVSDVPPVLTKSWYHTGAYFGEGGVSTYMQQEYYSEGDSAEALGGLAAAQFDALQLPDTVLPSTLFLSDGTRLSYQLSPEEMREACRALRGSLLRRETYGLDGSAAADRPYSVSESNYTIEAFQPQGPNQYGVYFSHAREAILLNYERQLYQVQGSQIVGPAIPAPAICAADPRVSHSLTLAVDPYGNLLQTAQVGYGRRYVDPNLTAADQATQSALLSTYAISTFTNAIDADDAHRAPLPADSQSFELLQVQPLAALPDVTNLFAFHEMQALLQGLGAGGFNLPYEDTSPTGLTPGQPYRRVTGRTQTYYRPDDLGASAGNARALLALGVLESRAVAGVAYKLAFTPGLLSQVYQRADTALLSTPATVLGSTAADGGGYVNLLGDGNWWIPTPRLYFVTGSPTSPAELTAALENFFAPRRQEDPFGNAGTVNYDADTLLPVQTTDAVGNVVSAVNDYRVLGPKLLTDANGNQVAATFHVLGLVTATAVMGKSGQNLGDTLTGFTVDLTQAQIDAFYDAADPEGVAAPLLGNATTRVVYDIHAFANSKAASPHDPTQWQPTFAAIIAREVHVSDLRESSTSPLQVGFSYSDGFGREVQRKNQWEPGPVVSGGPTVNPRWVGSGWTIFNNKGNPVRKYEPFFSQLPASGHRFEFGAEAGVSPILRYDPVSRVALTIFPNQTYTKEVYDPWNRQHWDVNDTVLITNPASDADVGNYFSRLPTADYIPTWYSQRSGGALGANEQGAATKAAVHANTPGVEYLDPLGRSFLTVVDNGSFGKYLTHVTLDIQDNQRVVIDPLSREAVRYDYSLLSERIHQVSMEAGERWTLKDAAGLGVRAWDSRGHNLRTAYDALRRPTGSYVLGTDAANSDPRTLAAEVQWDMIVYGEGQANDQALNLRTRIYQHNDTAGTVLNEVTDPSTKQRIAYDFKGNLLGSSRQFVQDQTLLPDWSKPAPALGADLFVSLVQYDALNRTVSTTQPDGTVVVPSYTPANLLATVSARLLGAAATTEFVSNIDYNPKSQRVLINYGNHVSTEYSYDPLTFRLTNLTTTRTGYAANQQTVQDLSYTYDPASNITHVKDDADIQNVVFFKNTRVDPSADFTYDPSYRLILSSGREQLGLSGSSRLAPAPSSYNDVPRIGLISPSDGNAMGTYSEQYQYNAAGGFMAVIHAGSDPANPGWTRTYNYGNPSLLVSTQINNQLTSSVVSGSMPLSEPYTYDPHGNMNSMPQLQKVLWDFQDRLLMTQRQAVNASDQAGTQDAGQQTWYGYDAAGLRVRKTTQSAAGVAMRERYYMGAYEVYRALGGGGATALEGHTLSVMEGNQRIAVVETKVIDTSVAATSLPISAQRYQFSNRLGTACLELDDTGAVITYEEYYPFGSTSYQAGRSVTEVSQKRYRFTGKERDTETGLYYHGARYYAPWLGIWTACDPIGIADDLHAYRYVKSNPISLVDPTGTEGDQPDAPVTLPDVPDLKLNDPTEPSNSGGDDKPQISLTNLSLTNPAWQAQNNPRGTLTTEFTLVVPFQSPTDQQNGWTLQPSFLTSIRDRTSATTEFGVYGGFGGQIPALAPHQSAGTGSLGASFHYGPDQPKEQGWGFGVWSTVGQLWQASPPKGYEFNPTGSVTLVESWMKSNVWGVDLLESATIGRLGSVNGVNVAAPLSPSLGVNFAFNLPGDNHVLNIEAVGGLNLGLGGRLDSALRTDTPLSGNISGGIGYQHTWGDYGWGVEAYFFTEQHSNVSNADSPHYNAGGGLRFDFGAINANRNVSSH